jgi:hypothetical protein
LTADNVLPDPDKTLSTVKMYMLALSSIISGYQLLTNFLMGPYSHFSPICTDLGHSEDRGRHSTFIYTTGNIGFELKMLVDFRE